MQESGKIFFSARSKGSLESTEPTETNFEVVWVYIDREPGIEPILAPFGTGP